MVALLRDWLVGARLGEIVHLIVLAKVELARRGIVLTWSLDQTNAEIPSDSAGEGIHTADPDGTTEHQQES